MEELNVGDAVYLIGNFQVGKSVPVKYAREMDVFGVAIEPAKCDQLVRIQVKGFISCRVGGCTAQLNDCGRGIRLCDTAPGSVIPWKQGSGRIVNVRKAGSGIQLVDVIL